jgi:hypothetical protein
MRWLFLALIGAFVIADVFGLGLSIATGLSVKNALLYAIGFALLFRIALQGGIRLELPSIHIAFVLLIGYATLSWVVAVAAIHYPGYHMLDGLITLKTRMIDPALMLVAAFYGIRNLEEARWVLGVLLLGVGAANAATLADTAGIYNFGMRVGDHGAEAGRVFGAFGHANDTGSFIVCILPAMIGMMVTHQGFRRLVWLGCLLASALVLILTVSRGAFVGLIVGGMWAAFMSRRYVPVQRLVMFGIVALIGVVLTVLIAGLVDPQIGNVLSERLLGQSKSYDVGDASSGRSALWGEILARMAREPITLLSGFGWNVYSVMPFRYAPHNHYLGLWFDLGIVGLGLFIFILARLLITVRRAIPIAKEQTRPHLLAFVFGIPSLAVAIIFADLYDPWSYIWLYVGIVLRMSVLVTSGAEEKVVVPVVEAPVIAPMPAPAIREGRSAFGGVLAGRPR